jgi:hypothetical protein
MLFPTILIILGYLIKICEYYYGQSIVIQEFVILQRTIFM